MDREEISMESYVVSPDRAERSGAEQIVVGCNVVPPDRMERSK
jgi:hypothetical protein